MTTSCPWRTGGDDCLIRDVPLTDYHQEWHETRGEVHITAIQRAVATQISYDLSSQLLDHEPRWYARVLLLATHQVAEELASGELLELVS